MLSMCCRHELNNSHSLCFYLKQESSISLPSSVFASEFEEEVGLLNKAAPISGEHLLSLPLKYHRCFTYISQYQKLYIVVTESVGVESCNALSLFSSKLSLFLWHHKIPTPSSSFSRTPSGLWPRHRGCSGRRLWLRWPQQRPGRWLHHQGQRSSVKVRSDIGSFIFFKKLKFVTHWLPHPKVCTINIALCSCERDYCSL